MEPKAQQPARSRAGRGRCRPTATAAGRARRSRGVSAAPDRARRGRRGSGRPRSFAGRRAAEAHARAHEALLRDLVDGAGVAVADRLLAVAVERVRADRRSRGGDLRERLADAVVQGGAPEGEPAGSVLRAAGGRALRRPSAARARRPRRPPGAVPRARVPAGGVVRRARRARGRRSAEPAAPRRTPPPRPRRSPRCRAAGWELAPGGRARTPTRRPARGPRAAACAGASGRGPT